MNMHYTPYESWYDTKFVYKYSFPDQERPVDDNGQVSTQSSPDLGNLTDFHQLILLRILRPDRLPSAMSRYVNRHLTSVKPLASSIGSLIGSSERLLGVMVMLPPTPAFGNKQLMSNFSLKQKPTGVLHSIAQVCEIDHCLCGIGTYFQFWYNCDLSKCWRNQGQYSFGVKFKTISFLNTKSYKVYNQLLALNSILVRGQYPSSQPVTNNKSSLLCFRTQFVVKHDSSSQYVRGQCANLGF